MGLNIGELRYDTAIPSTSFSVPPVLPGPVAVPIPCPPSGQFGTELSEANDAALFSSPAPGVLH